MVDAVLGPWATIINVHWPRVALDYVAFSITLRLGPAAPGGVDISDLICSPADFDYDGGGFEFFDSSYTVSWEFPFELDESSVVAYNSKTEEWGIGMPGSVEITGLPFTDIATYEPWRADVPRFPDYGRITPVTPGTSGIKVPFTSDFFGTDTSAKAENIGDRLEDPLCLPSATVIPPDGLLTSPVLGHLVSVSDLASGIASILSRVDLKVDGVIWPAVGAFTIPRDRSPDPGIAGTGLDMPKIMWVLCHRPSPA